MYVVCPQAAHIVCQLPMIIPSLVNMLEIGQSKNPKSVHLNFLKKFQNSPHTLGTLQMVPENLYFQNTSEKQLKSGKIEKNKTTFTLTTFKVGRVKVVLFFRNSCF